MENAILVGLDISGDNNFNNSMYELENLAKACFINVLKKVTQKRTTPTANFYIGEGKVQEIKSMIETLDANLVIFNDELSPSHIRNLEKELDIRVIDRTVLILDIFARRAKTKEAMLQVELAQSEYMLPRVTGMHDSLSRQRSGTGSKGPGEQQLELDRRLLRAKITKLKNDLSELVKIRRSQREKRKKNNIHTVALAGYTNAGKSTLMNAIIDYSSTHKDKYAFNKNMLFATLQTKTRRIHLENNHDFLLTDTVGFIEKLPHNLIEAFKSTLEEISEASIILHVIDLSNSNYENQILTVDEVLKDIGVKNIPIIHVYNKIDLVKTKPIHSRDNSIFVSAKKVENIDNLINMIDKMIYKNEHKVHLLLPFDKSNIYSELKENANIISTIYSDDGINLYVELDDYFYNKYQEYIQ